MKKQLAAVFAATAVLGVTTAFAANPFSDVTPQDWAYQAVAQLASEGVIEGYPDGTFKGQNNITRYEMAQMIARMMARQSKLDAEQNAMINRLAQEFSAELNNLGVRVSKLEDKVGTFSFRGDLRARFQGADSKSNYSALDLSKKSKFDVRARVNFNAQVAENTQAHIRLTSGNFELGDSSASSKTTIDRAYVEHNFGKNVNLKAGRYNEFVGQGLVYDDTFDGAEVRYGTDKLNATAAYGYAMAGSAAGKNFASQTTDTNTEFGIFGLNGKIGNKVDVNAYYMKANGGNFATTSSHDNNGIFGAAVTAKFNAVTVGGEWARFEHSLTDGQGKESQAWIAGIGVGNYDISKAGSWDIKAQYLNEGKDSPVISSTWVQPLNADYKAWLATVDYAVSKNIGLSGYATIDSKDRDGNSLPEYYRAELNYKF